MKTFKNVAGFRCRFSMAISLLANRVTEISDVSYSLSGMDRQLLEFVEAGANDGVNQSNTLLFERHLGWRGILVEPVPELFRQCQINRPKARCVHAALVADDDPRDQVEMWSCGLMSFVEGSFRSPQEAEDHLSNSRLMNQPVPERVSVSARTLSSILDEAKVRQVDLLSLDVEGFEAQALGGIDFARHRPRYILVEARYPDAVHAVLDPHYKQAAQFNERDLLFVAQNP
jgi:FkbM family methyltransferase